MKKYIIKTSKSIALTFIIVIVAILVILFLFGTPELTFTYFKSTGLQILRILVGVALVEFVASLNKG